MAQGKAECIYARRVNASKTRAVEESLSNAFQANHESTNTGLKTVSYYFVESVLTEMGHNGVLDEALVRNIERWARLSTCLDAVAKHALSSPQFVRTVATFFSKTMRDQDDKKKIQLKLVEFLFQSLSDH